MRDASPWTRFKQGIGQDLRRVGDRLGSISARVQDWWRSRLLSRKLFFVAVGIGFLIILSSESITALSQTPWHIKVIGLGFFLIVLLLLLWRLPKWKATRLGLRQKEQFDVENESRKTWATIVRGMAVLFSLLFTWENLRVTQETATDSQELTRQGQINELFTKAIDQLGAVNHKGEKQLEIRLGGIYALEWIARISEPHHWPIMEVLTAYVRAHAPAPPKDAQPTKCDQAPEEKSPATLSQPPSQVAAEIQAVLTVLGRRTRTYGKGEKKGEERLNLAETDLRPKAFLRRAEFEAVIFRGAWLEGADLRRAQLRGADFRGARLKDADFLAAHLEGAQNLTVEQLSTAKTLHEACLDPPLREQIQQRYPRLLEKP